LLEFLLVVVLLLFAASLLGLLPSRGPHPEGAGEEGWGDEPRVLQAVAPAGGERFGEPAGRGALRRGLPPAGRRPADADEAGAEAPIRLHLANGCGVARFAAEMRERFREAGFDVRGISNADSDGYRETIVVQRSAERRHGEAVVAFLQGRWGVGRLILQERPTPALDVLVILGPDLAAALAAPEEARSTR
jgi:hypothetical protein